MTTQHNPILEALALLPHEEQERILADALSAVTVEELERVLLQLPLQEVSSNTKARVAFRMGMTPLGHTEFNGGNARDWVLAVPAMCNVPCLFRHCRFRLVMKRGATNPNRQLLPRRQSVPPRQQPPPMTPPLMKM